MGGSMISARFGVEGDQEIEQALKKMEQGAEEFAQALKKAADEGTVSVDEVEKALEKLGTQIEDTGSKAGKMGADVAGGGKKAADGLKDAEKAGVSLGTTIGTTIVGAVTAAVGALTTLAAKGYSVFASIKDVAEQSGLTVQQVQLLRVAVQEAGGEVDGLNRALQTATRTVGSAVTGNATMAKSLDDLGIAYRNVDGSARPMHSTLMDIFDAIAKLPTEQERAAAGTAIFGKEWVKLAPILAGGSESLRLLQERLTATGQLMSVDQVKSLDSLQKEVNKAKAAWEQLALVLTAKVAPALEHVASYYSTLLTRTETRGASVEVVRLANEQLKLQGELAKAEKALADVEARGNRGTVLMGKVDGRPWADVQRERIAALRAEMEKLAAAEEKLKTAEKQRAEREEMIRRGGNPLDHPLGVPPGYRAPGKDKPEKPEKTGGGGKVDQTAKEYERAQEALDKYLESLSREADLSDESARERAGHTAQLKAEALARVEVLKLSDEEIRAKGEEARAIALVAFDRRKAIEDEKDARQKAERQMEQLAEREAKLLAQPAEHAIKNVQSLFTDLFTDIMAKNLVSWDDFWGRAKDVARRYLAELATLMIIRPIIQPLFMAAGAGGLVPGMGGTQTITMPGGQTATIQSGGGLFGGGGLGIPGLGGGDLFGAGGFLNRPLFGSFGLFGGGLGLGGSGLAGAGLGLGADVLGGVGAAGSLSGVLGGLFGIGSGIMGLAGGNPIGGGLGILGGGLGLLSGAGVIGSAFGPIGMALGLFGSLFGGLLGKKPKAPQEVSNIMFGADGITNAIGFSRGRSLGSTGPAAAAFADVFMDLLGAYDLSTGPGFTGGWIANSVGKKTGNQWFTGFGTYDPGNAGLTIAQGLTSPEQAIDILAAALIKRGAEEGTLVGLSATQTTALRTADLKSIEDVKKALDFSKLYDRFVRLPESITAAGDAIEEIEEQAKALARTAEEYGLDTGIIDTRRQEAINRIATDINDDSRRRLLALTPEGALQIALEDHDRALEAARRNAIEANRHVVGGTLADINQLERAYAEERRRIIESANAAANAAIRSLWERLSHGDLSFASPIAALTGAQGTAEALYAQAQAGSLTAREQLPQAVAELFQAQVAFSGNDPRYEALRQLWLERLAPFIAANANITGGGTANDPGVGVVAQLQRQVDAYAQQSTQLMGRVDDLTREISRLLARL